MILPDDCTALTDTDRAKVQDIKRLFEEHRSSLEHELGATICFNDVSHGPRRLVGPFDCNSAIRQLGLLEPDGPQIYLDRASRIFVTHGKTPDETTETYSYLRSLYRFEGGVWDIQECESIDDAIERVIHEVRCSYPSFRLRDLNWDALCEKYVSRVRLSRNPVGDFQQWLAELQDAHTWVRPFPPLPELPYDLYVMGDKAIFYRVPQGSDAWNVGVRPGDFLLDEDTEDWWRRTGATPHSKPFVVGKRILSSQPNLKRHLKAEIRNGKIVEWEETPTRESRGPVVTWKTLDSGNGYLRIQAWIIGRNVEESIDVSITELGNCSRLIVDLRGNPGGSLLMAHRFRNRFLRQDGPVGWIQTSRSDGTLPDREPIFGQVSRDQQRWSKPVVFLTDPLTYSASEDALLGLQGENHVRVVGQKSGGGSGRMRLIRLLPGYRLTISTALTFDKLGNCIEGSGIPVDHEIPIRLDAEVDAPLKCAQELEFH